MHERDLEGKAMAWYRFSETPWRVYGPRDLAFVFRTYGSRDSCETAIAGPDGQPIEPWFPASTLRRRLKSQAVQPAQLRRLQELGVSFDASTLDKIDARELIETFELQLPASPEEVEKARDAGAAVVDGMTRGEIKLALVPIEEAKAKDQLREELAPRVASLSDRGVAIEEDIEEEDLEAIELAFTDYDSVLAEARTWGLPASKARNIAPRSLEDCVITTAKLQEWIELVSSNDKSAVGYALDREREPSDRTMNAVTSELFELVMDGRTPVAIDVWFTDAVRRVEGDRKPFPQARRPDVDSPLVKNVSTGRRSRLRRYTTGLLATVAGLALVLILAVALLS